MNLKTIILVCIGFLCLAAGAVGLLLPVWPTTPFVLLSAACFSSTPRLRSRIIKIPFFKEHIENYEHRTGLGRKTLVISLVWLWGALFISALLTDIRYSPLLICVGAAVTCHLSWMAKSRNPEPEDTSEHKTDRKQE